ncbi:MAG: PEP-CTERM sorting domain-containing protein [Planctomycetota bacterium]
MLKKVVLCQRGSTAAGWVASALAAVTASAGPFSPGKGGPDEAGFVDAGVAGFVDGQVNPIFVGWASGYTAYHPSDVIGPYSQNGIATGFADPTKTLGPVTGSNVDIASLGDMHVDELDAYAADPFAGGPGELVLTFDTAITNGPGVDFAAFENGFVSNYSTGAGSVRGQMFAELGFVEVSTDGVHFARFPSQFLNYPDGVPGTADSLIDLDGDPSTAPTNAAYLTQDVSNLYNLVGKHANAYGTSYGTPFDLDDLLTDPLVTDGLVDPDEIHYVKIVDIPGNGHFTDSLGNPIFDAWVTWGSGGLDFEALGVIHQVPEPTAAGLLALSMIVTLARRRR